jgi:two-component system response regulator FixJ
MGQVDLRQFRVVEQFEREGRRYVVAVLEPGLSSLTPREREVLVEAVNGSTNKVIAYDLGLSHATVRVLMARAAKKLGVTKRSDLVAEAVARGFAP